MNNKLITLLTTACLSMAINGVANANPDQAHDKQHHCAKGSHSGHHSGMHHGKPPFLHGIQLTSEQDDKVFALTHAEVPKIREHMKQRHELKQTLMALSQTSTFDEAKAKQLADKLANLERDGALNHAKFDSKIFAILTPEQREQAIKNKARYDERRGEHLPTRFHHKGHHDRAIKS